LKIIKNQYLEKHAKCKPNVEITGLESISQGERAESNEESEPPRDLVRMARKGGTYGWHSKRAARRVAYAKQKKRLPRWIHTALMNSNVVQESATNLKENQKLHLRESVECKGKGSA
jgi:hypothetical protein